MTKVSLWEQCPRPCCLDDSTTRLLQGQRGWSCLQTLGPLWNRFGHYGIAAVIRNDKGQLMGAMSKRFPFTLGALEVQAKTAECGVIFAWELGLIKIILEGDSKVVMHSVADSHPAP